MTDRFRAGKRLWDPEDDVELRRLFPDAPTIQLVPVFRRTLQAIRARAGTLGLHKSAAFMASPHAYRFRRGQGGGEACRFAKGHVPANKGTRRPGWHRGRMKETQFKKGQLNGVAAHRFMPIGSFRIADGYLYRKISAVPGPWTVNWKMEHVLVWARAHGPVPSGHALAFRNRDRTDVRLENLELLTRRELMARNTVHNLPKPLAQTVQLLGQLNRQIRRRTRHAEQR